MNHKIEVHRRGGIGISKAPGRISRMSWLIAPAILIVSIAIVLQVPMFKPNEFWTEILIIGFGVYWLSVIANLVYVIRSGNTFFRGQSGSLHFSPLKIFVFWLTTLLQAVSLWTFIK